MSNDLPMSGNAELYQQWTLLPEDSHASKPPQSRRCINADTVYLEKTAASGGTISELCAPPGPFGSLSKMLQVSANGPIRSRIVWRGLATLFPNPNTRLRMLVHLIRGCVCSLLPTLTARDFKHPGRESHPRLLRKIGLPLPTTFGENISPEFGEWIMGFPAGWTELNPSEMPLSPKSPNGLEKE